MIASHRLRKYHLGDDRVAELLVQAGADVNLRNNDEDTALHIAAFIGIMMLTTFCFEQLPVCTDAFKQKGVFAHDSIRS